MALSFGSVISFFYICIVNEKDGLRQARVYTPSHPYPMYTIVDTT